MAIMAPTSVAFTIHHVASKFQMNIVKYVRPKKRLLLVILSAHNNRGIKAKKMIGVRGDIGHAAHNNIPDERDKNNGLIFFK